MGRKRTKGAKGGRAASVGVVVAGLALVVAAAAFAARGDPQEKLTPADQARAKALLLRKADIGGPVDVDPQSPQDRRYCKATDQSDLVISGKAKSPLFLAHGIEDIAFSTARIYISVADASAAWRRVTSSAGVACAVTAARRDFGSKFVSWRNVSFPLVAPQVVGYRLTIRTKGQLGYFDFILFRHSRAAASLVFGSDLVPWAHSDQIRIARIITGRMATAMRNG